MKVTQLTIPKLKIRDNIKTHTQLANCVFNWYEDLIIWFSIHYNVGAKYGIIYILQVAKYNLLRNYVIKKPFVFMAPEFGNIHKTRDIVNRLSMEQKEILRELQKEREKYIELFEEL